MRQTACLLSVIGRDRPSGWNEIDCSNLNLTNGTRTAAPSLIQGSSDQALKIMPVVGSPF